MTNQELKQKLDSLQGDINRIATNAAYREGYDIWDLSDDTEKALQRIHEILTELAYPRTSESR